MRTLALQGPATAPVAERHRHGQERELDARRSTPRAGCSAASPPAATAPRVVGGPGRGRASNVRYDVRLVAPSTLRIENDQARIVASADLKLRGTFDRPLLFGRAEIERGEVRFEGRRYLVTRGSLDFTNPDRIQPFFDIEAETRVRVPGQTYRVTLRMAGTTERLQPRVHVRSAAADARHPDAAVQRSAPSGDVELAALQQPNQREQRLLEARATRALTGALSAEVGRVVQQTFGVDTFQITPLLSIRISSRRA